MCNNFMVIRHSIKELSAKSMVTRPMKCIGSIVTRNIQNPKQNTLKQTNTVYEYKCNIGDCEFRHYSHIGQTFSSEVIIFNQWKIKIILR